MAIELITGTAAPGLIYSILPTILSEVDAIPKSRKNPSQGYSFRGIDDLYNELHGLFAKHKIVIVPRVVNSLREERVSGQGKAMIYTVMDVEFEFLATDASSVKAICRGEGADMGDKATNKAQSAALKYALMQMFLIPTEEDKDTENASPEFQPRQQAAPPQNSAPDQSADRNQDTRPWLTELQFKAMMDAIAEGKAGLVLAKMENYKIRRDYREKLNEALSAAQVGK